jgi:rhodanese-related sulfurtransferase
MHRREAVFTLLGSTTLLAQGTGTKEKSLTADELKELLEKKENLFFLDVREPKELEQLGTIKGYVNIPLSQLERRITEIPKNKLIITA